MPTSLLESTCQRIAAATMKGPRGRVDIRVDSIDGRPAVVVESLPALVRVLGHVKYAFQDRQILLRGQRKCYGSMKPAFYRDHSEADHNELERFLDDVRKKAKFDAAPEHAPSTEPLLQHYGFNTRWLDLVDSLPYALFFATHRLARVRTGQNLWTYTKSSEDFGYVYMIDCGNESGLGAYTVRTDRGDSVVGGMWSSTGGFALCDLRRNKPSKALRPHAQHGYLCRPDRDETDLWSRVIVRAAVPVDKAISWLGFGECVKPEVLFPHPDEDPVYQSLTRAELSSLVASDPKFTAMKLGEIQQFSFHPQE